MASQANRQPAIRILFDRTMSWQRAVALAALCAGILLLASSSGGGRATDAGGPGRLASGFPGADAAVEVERASLERSLSFEERVRYQHRIEEVYWSHRIWPAENPGAKPPLDEVLPDAVIRERVQTYLEKSAALEVQTRGSTDCSHDGRRQQGVAVNCPAIGIAA